MLLFVEVTRLVEPFVTEYLQERADRTHKDFYTFLKIAMWWQERGTSLPVKGIRGGTVVADAKDMVAGVHKRIWKDLPADRQRPEGELDAEVRGAAQLDMLYIPELGKWQNAAAVWDRFRNWITDNVKDYDDYASEFVDVENPAIRSTGREGFQNRSWEMRTGKVEGDHVVEVWEPSAELTTIMQATARRVIAGTENKIAEQKARPPDRIATGPVLRGAMFTQDDDPDFGSDFGVVTGTAHFKEGRHPNVYGQYQLREHQNPFKGCTEDPKFIVYGDHPSPRVDYVLVGGGDYNTYAAIRASKVWVYDPRDTVKWPKKTVKPYEVIPTDPVLTKEEEAAVAALRHGHAEFRAYDSAHTLYRGEIRFPYWTPNTWGVFFVKREDLEIIAMQPRPALPALDVPSLPGVRTRIGPGDTGGSHPGPVLVGPQIFSGPPGSSQPTVAPGIEFRFKGL